MDKQTGDYYMVRQRQQPSAGKDGRARIVVATWLPMDRVQQLDDAVQSTGAKSRASFMRGLVEAELDRLAAERQPQRRKRA